MLEVGLRTWIIPLVIPPYFISCLSKVVSLVVTTVTVKPSSNWSNLLKIWVIWDWMLHIIYSNSVTLCSSAPSFVSTWQALSKALFAKSIAVLLKSNAVTAFESALEQQQSSSWVSSPHFPFNKSLTFTYLLVPSWTIGSMSLGLT